MHKIIASFSVFLSLLLTSSCAIVSEEDIAASDLGSSNATLSTGVPKDSLWLRSRLQSYPMSILLMHITETEGKFSIMLTEAEALSLGIPSDLYRSVLQSLNK